MTCKRPQAVHDRCQILLLLQNSYYYCFDTSIQGELPLAAPLSSLLVLIMLMKCTSLPDAQLTIYYLAANDEYAHSAAKVSAKTQYSKTAERNGVPDDLRLGYTYSIDRACGALCVRSLQPCKFRAQYLHISCRFQLPQHPDGFGRQPYYKYRTVNLFTDQHNRDRVQFQRLDEPHGQLPVEADKSADRFQRYYIWQRDDHAALLDQQHAIHWKYRFGLQRLRCAKLHRRAQRISAHGIGAADSEGHAARKFCFGVINYGVVFHDHYFNINHSL